MFSAIRKSIWLGASLFVSLVIATVSRPAYAGLVYRDVNVTLDASAGFPYNLDVDLDGTTDFTFTSTFAPDPTFPVGFNVVDFSFGSNNGVVIDAPATDGFPTVSRLGIGSIVSNSSLFSLPSDQGNLTFFTPFDPPSGNFEGQSGYVGLKFDRLGGTAFGFAEISVNAMNAAVNPLGLTIRSVTYNDTLGASATITAVPEPSSMALAVIGVGLFGASQLRKKLGKSLKRIPLQRN